MFSWLRLMGKLHATPTAELLPHLQAAQEEAAQLSDMLFYQLGRHNGGGALTLDIYEATNSVKRLQDILLNLDWKMRENL